MRRWGVVVGISAGVLITACGGSSGGAPLTAHTSRTIAVGDAADGRTVDARVGDTIVVTLHSTYWTLGHSTGGVLSDLSSPSAAPGGSGCPHVPGSGCGTLTATYRASSAGSATLSAHRNSCGEALRCTGKQSTWSVRVRVS